MWIDSLGYIGAVLTIATYAVGTMIPLRIVALTANITFLVYSLITRDYPTVVMDCVLIPLNGFRLWQMVRLTREVRIASDSDFSMDWIKAYADPIEVRSGTVLFRQGDTADVMYYIESGRFRLIEAGLELGAGQIVGELGLVAPDSKRTQGLECVETGRMLKLSYAHFKELYFQNPRFGFYFLRLISERLFSNANSAKTEGKAELEAAG